MNKAEPLFFSPGVCVCVCDCLCLCPAVACFPGICDIATSNPVKLPEFFCEYVCMCVQEGDLSLWTCTWHLSYYKNREEVTTINLHVATSVISITVVNRRLNAGAYMTWTMIHARMRACVLTHVVAVVCFLAEGGGRGRSAVPHQTDHDRWRATQAEPGVADGVVAARDLAVHVGQHQGGRRSCFVLLRFSVPHCPELPCTVPHRPKLAFSILHRRALPCTAL